MRKRKFTLTKQELEELYWNQRLSTLEIAKKIGVHHSTVRYWMIKYGVERRHQKASMSRKEYVKKYYQEHKNELRKKNKEYKMLHKARLRKISVEKYKKEREKWLGEVPKITKEISRKAEVLAKSILEHEGFKEVTSFTRQSVFDFFAKKDGKLCGIDVTTAMRKPIRFQQIQMANYFDLKFYILFIKPDFTKYRIVEVPKSYLKKKIEYKSLNVHSLKDFKDIQTEIIRLDIDSSLLPLWEDDWRKAQTAIIESFGYLLKKTIIRQSGHPLPWKEGEKPAKGKGYHVWHHILVPHQLDDLEKLKLQFLLGSDPGRCWINYLRIKRGINNWDKIFGYVLWRRPLPEQCQKCSLRVNLEKIAEEEEVVPD
ncbi:MAG: hypothetical protein QXM02_07550, partial [Thermoproteota archaeon]